MTVQPTRDQLLDMTERLGFLGDRPELCDEVVDGLIDAWLGEYGTPETRDAGIAARDYRETNYRLPEETPND